MEQKIISITEQELELEDYLDMQTAVRVYGNSLIKNDSMHIFVSDSALDEWADRNHFYEVDELPVTIMTFGAAVDYAVKNKVSVLYISGFYDELSSLSGDELKAAGDLAKKYCLLVSAKKSEADAKRAAKALRECEVYIHGTLPSNLAKGDGFGTETMKRSKDGKEWTAVPVFLNERSAKKQNSNDAPVSKCRLCDVAFLYRTMFKIFVEPYLHYGYEFEAEDIFNK
ncbi:MAG: hypothetical protein ACI4QV_05925 [Acutalibacteraceae bacterium]